MCSATCRSIAARRGAKHLWTPLRRALELGDCRATLDELRKRSDLNSNGCWVWRARLKDGYPVIKVAKKSLQAHRVSLEAKVGKPLGKQAAHHVCANPACVNPEHLQPVTARENVAEMLARTYMESRIADLESALALHDSDHPLLREVGVATAA
jgi:hypothetical protein